MNEDKVIPGTVLEEEILPTEPVEPTEPTEPIEPTEPVEPAPVEPTEPVEPDEPKEPVEPAETPPSPREAKRIQNLVEKLKAKESAAAPSATPASLPGQFDFKTALDAEPEVIQQIEAEVARRVQEAEQRGANTASTQQANSTMFHTRLEIDAPRMESKYPKIDPSSDSFDSVAANLLNQSYLSITGYDPKTGGASNPNVRYSDFVEGMMELADRMADEKTATVAKTIAKQAAKTGIRPGGAAARGLNLNQAPSEMTDEELEARIATVIPKR